MKTNHFMSVTNPIILPSVSLNPTECQSKSYSNKSYNPISLATSLTRTMLDDGSPTSTNLANDHGFINKEYSLHWYEAFWGNPKQSHESLCSKWTISYDCGESCSSNKQNQAKKNQPQTQLNNL